MISFIIPNRGGKNIKFICNKLKELYKDCEIVVVTQEDNNPFARGQLFNIGYKHTVGEYICFIDNDIFFPKYVDLISMYRAEKCIAMQPFDIIAQVTLSDKGKYAITSQKRLGPSSKGGITFISRQNFEKINGMSNLYLGWGYEDNEFDSRANGIKRTKGMVCHISHPVRSGDNQANTSLNKTYFMDRGERDYKSDGYLDTIYDTVLDKKDGCIRNVTVKNIRVEDAFKYKQLYEKHFSMDDRKLKIAIVGNSPILLEKELGSEIDSHDIIVRFNNFTTDGYEKHTGVKTTDICFNAYTQFNGRILLLPKEHRLFFYAKETNDELDKLLYRKYAGKLTLSDVTIIDNDKYYKELSKKLNAENGWQGSSGLIMCQMMADVYPDAIIDVYGITFFKDTIKRKEGERFHKIHHLDGTVVNSGHDSNAEWAYYEKYLKDKINLHL